MNFPEVFALQPVSNQIPDQFFCTVFHVKIAENKCGGYAESPQIGLSLFKSMVPAGGIEPTA